MPPWRRGIDFFHSATPLCSCERVFIGGYGLRLLGCSVIYVCVNSRRPLATVARLRRDSALTRAKCIGNPVSHKHSRRLFLPISVAIVRQPSRRPRSCRWGYTPVAPSQLLPVLIASSHSHGQSRRKLLTILSLGLRFCHLWRCLFDF